MGGIGLCDYKQVSGHIKERKLWVVDRGTSGTSDQENPSQYHIISYLAL